LANELQALKGELSTAFRFSQDAAHNRREIELLKLETQKLRQLIEKVDMDRAVHNL
jgi:hypothetical protein